MARPGLLVMVALAPAAASADDGAASPTRAGYEPTGRLLDFEARRRADVDGGVDPMLTSLFEMFVSPQLEDRVDTAGLLMLEVDFALDKLIGRGWGAAHASGLVVYGDGLSTELMDVLGVSSTIAPPDQRLFEAWIEQPIGAFTLRAGLLAADQEFVLAESASTLVSATFGMTAQFSANIGGPVYPVATPGASGRLALGAVTARLAIYDGTQNNTRGIPDALGPARLVMGEIAVGAIKLGGWTHDERGEGIYAIADTSIDHYIGAFARAGYSPDAPITHYIDAGVRITPGPRRADDHISAGIAFATTETGQQTMIEINYELQIGWLTLQPDAQLLMLHHRSVGIAGLRSTVVF